jgi:ABC-2 type transport system ATP-binding protein
MTRPVIETRNLRKRYGRAGGIESVDLAVEAGQIYGFVGPNGAGKTTTIRVLLGFLRAAEGVARIFGRDCWHHSHIIKRDVGYLPGDLRLYPWLTAQRAIYIASRVRGVDLADAARELAARFDLPMNQRVRTMSRGMRQKLGIVLALAHRPRLLILDEPTTGLDPPMRIELANCLRERVAVGDTVFFSSHSLAEVEQLCDRVGIVRDGCMVADESIVEWRERAPRVVVLRFHTPAAAAAAVPPDFLQLTRRQDTAWYATLHGSSIRLMQWIATQPVADAAVERPDLETLFHSYYLATRGPA